MYLSRFTLNPRDRQARRDLADPYELHRTLSKPFQDALTQDRERLLWRLEQPRGKAPHVLLQSRTEPHWSAIDREYFLGAPQCKAFRPELAEGQRLRFRLRANPVVSREGKRHALYEPEQRLDWLMRKGQQGGFDIRTVMISQEERVQAKRFQRQRRITLVALTFDGVMEVRDPEAVRQALGRGIGPGKGLGMGLLSIASV